MLIHFVYDKTTIVQIKDALKVLKRRDHCYIGEQKSIVWRIFSHCPAQKGKEIAIFVVQFIGINTRKKLCISNVLILGQEKLSRLGFFQT